VTVALLGTGTMGAGMARRIATTGDDLRVWNRTRERAEPLADVATVCDEVGEAVAGADVVVTMLFDADAVEETVRRGAGHYRDDAVWLQCSTVGVDGSARLARVAEELGLDHLDSPVLGTKDPAEQGSLVVLASGRPELRPRVDDVLGAIGSKTVWVGDEPSAGSRLKLACNAWMLTIVQAVAESLAMTRAFGVDPELFLQAVHGSAVEAPYVGIKGRAMLDGDFDPDFALSGGLKDLDLVMEAVSGLDVDPQVLPAVRAQFAAAQEAGYGDEDLAATYRRL